MKGEVDDIQCYPLTPDRWPDFEALFGEQGAYGGCWCMYWRVTRSEFGQQQGMGNRWAFKRVVDDGMVPGILAYCDEEPVGWISVAPREHFASLERSPVLKRVDDKPVWSIVCFYIDKNFRGMSLSETLIKAALQFVSESGGRIIEAYPTIPKENRLAPVSVYMGVPAAFERVGFEQVAQPSKRKIIMRYYLGKG